MQKVPPTRIENKREAGLVWGRDMLRQDDNVSFSYVPVIFTIISTICQSESWRSRERFKIQ